MSKKNKKKGFIDVLVGLQWGDEGKGKNIDELLSLNTYSAVARFQGGSNAGHTLKYKNLNFIGHIIPSGCLHKNVELYIGNGVVVDIISLIKEINELKKLGFNIMPRLYISNRAKLVSYLHPFLDQAEENYRSNTGKKIGTTAKGIGPAYSDSRARRGLLVGDILFSDFYKKEKKLSDFHMNFLKSYQENYGYKIPKKEIKKAKIKWLSALKELKKLKICDLSFLINQRLNEGKNILAEGAQGIMLDIDFGDYPNVTSSNTLPINVCLGLGVSHKFVRNIYGVIKAYTTKVGGGDFPSRIENRKIEKLFQDAGHEFGATTGRPRMCGWLDLFALEYAIRISGVNKIYINKADICPVDNIKIVTGYKYKGQKLKEYPFHLSKMTKMITEKMIGWGKTNYGISKKEKASPELIKYIKYLNDKLKTLDVEIISIGTGPDRNHYFSLK